MGLDRASFWEMTLREFLNAWIGAAEDRSERAEATRDIVFSAHRFSASATAMSKEASRKIARHKFPWERGGNGKPQPLNYDSMKGFFNMISTKDDG